MASAPARDQRAPVRPIRSCTRYRHAPSITPVAIGSPRERTIVVQPAGVLREIAGRLEHRLARERVEGAVLRHEPQALRDLAAAAPLEQTLKVMLDPRFSLGRALVMERVGRAPQVLQHVDDIEHDRDLDAGGSRGALDPAKLVRLPSTRTTHLRRRSGSRRSASANASSMTRWGLCSTLAHTRLFSGRGRSASRLSPRPCNTSAIVRGHASSEYTAATSAIRLRFGFSPFARRVCIRRGVASAALRVAARRSSSRIAMFEGLARKARDNFVDGPQTAVG